MEKAKSGINVFVKILTGIIVILLILGILGGVLYLLNSPQGLYVEYNGTVYGSTANYPRLNTNGTNMLPSRYSLRKIQSFITDCIICTATVFPI